jgi:hypothetical protein
MTDRERRVQTLVDKHAKEHCPLVQLRSIGPKMRKNASLRRVARHPQRTAKRGRIRKEML